MHLILLNEVNKFDIWNIKATVNLVLKKSKIILILQSNDIFDCFILIFIKVMKL